MLAREPLRIKLEIDKSTHIKARMFLGLVLFSNCFSTKAEAAVAKEKTPSVLGLPNIPQTRK